jgi:DNA modification methylase
VSVLRGDCVAVMAGMEPESVDALVTDPPYGLEFMGKEWDSLDTPAWRAGQGGTGPASRTNGVPFGGGGKRVRYGQGNQQAWHTQWATTALRVAKPGAYLLAFGGTRTVHRMTCALEDAGWVIRDMLMWVYLSGFPKSKASLKPAYEPIILCRKPGASRDLNIDATRIGYVSEADREQAKVPQPVSGFASPVFEGKPGRNGETFDPGAGRWPSNVVMTEDVFGGGVDEVVGGGWQSGGGNPKRRIAAPGNGLTMGDGWTEDYETGKEPVDTAGSKSRVFIIPKAPTSERVLSDGRRSPHPTQKPEALIRHLVKLVTPDGGLVLDPFLGSGTLGVVCEGLGMRWLGIEREAEYADWAEARIADGRPKWAVA